MIPREQFLDNLILYNLGVLQLKGVNISKTTVKNADIVISLGDAIENFYNHYKNNNNNIPYPGDYIKIVKNEYINEIDQIKKDIINYKIKINEYIDTNIKPIKKKDDEEFKNTSVLKFIDVGENLKIESTTFRKRKHRVKVKLLWYRKTKSNE